MRDLEISLATGASSAPTKHDDVRQTRTLAARLGLAILRVYQRFLSPVLPVVTLGGCACRFSPTCSEYAAQAIVQHGALRGAWLAAIRLIKCTPLHPGGFDPVPVGGTRRWCHSVSRQSPTTLSLRNG